MTVTAPPEVEVCPDCDGACSVTCEECDGFGTVTCYTCDGAGERKIPTCEAVWLDETLTEQGCDRQEWEQVQGVGRLCSEHKRQLQWAKEHGKTWSKGRLVPA
jgi:hypothetical protein